MSVASNLAALGALMKTNLEAKGVTGLTSDMGLTTLANKILEIPSGGPSTTLSLTGSSPIISSGETCSLSGLLTSNGQAVENEIIIFYNDDDTDPLAIGDSCDNFIFKADAELGNGYIDLSTPQLYPLSIYWNEHGYFSILYDTNDQHDVTSPNLQGDTLYRIGDTFITNEGDSFTLPSEYSSYFFVDNISHADEFHPIIGAGFTNFQGIVSVDYVGTGFGDVTVVAEATVNGTFLQETYELEDCVKYDTTEHSQSHSTNTSTSYAIYNDFSFDLTDFEIVFDQKISNNGGAISLENPSDRSKNLMISRGSDGIINAESNSFNAILFANSSDADYHTIKFIKQGTTLTMKYDNITQTTTVNSSFDIVRTVKFRMWRSNTAYIKNLKIKAL